MSSRASTPPINDDDDDLRGILDAMDQNSPIRPTPKRTHGTMAGDDDGSTSDNDQSPPAPSQFQVTPTNQNITAAARNYGQRKRLRGEQITELEVFLNDPNLLRETKLFTSILAVGNQVSEMVASQPSFKISSDLETNIQKYAPAVLLSSKINDYKGEGPTNILLAILKKYCFDIPTGLENNKADWDKIVAAVQEALTQSLKIHKTDTEYAADSQHQNIFELTQAIVKGTQCSVNVVLCARVALMRSVYLKHPDPKFWDKMDERLAKIRKQANGDATKITKVFRHVLTVDQDKHGIKDYELDEKAIDDFQKTVDDVIDVGTVNAATSAAS
ncbi:hypothetical protein C8J57DRAFT_1500023 [Mycena rebaudengoi]|nr:hypothetical protein C8J57DRAFT_1500023 [Mycena rebaudengoi]